jgi:hypothetical protein
MKMTAQKFINLVLLPATLLAIAGCSSTTPRPQDKTTMASYEPGVPGGTLVETYQTTGKVTEINAATRQVTLMAPDGSTNTFRAGPKFQNFDRYRVGDQLKVFVARELTAYLDKSAPPPSPNVAAIAQTTPGAQPGALTSDPKQLTATITAVNPEKQEVTLDVSDGRSGTIKVRKDIDMTQMKAGDQVVIRISSALAVMATKQE